MGEELLKPMKPPEFDSDEEISTNRSQEKRKPTISSDDDAETASGMEYELILVLRNLICI